MSPIILLSSVRQRNLPVQLSYVEDGKKIRLAVEAIYQQTFDVDNAAYAALGTKHIRAKYANIQNMWRKRNEIPFSLK